jgi:hypothetical protein
VLDSSLQPLIGLAEGETQSRDVTAPVEGCSEHAGRIAKAALWTPWDLDAALSTTGAGTGFPLVCPGAVDGNRWTRCELVTAAVIVVR